MPDLGWVMLTAGIVLLVIATYLAVRNLKRASTKIDTILAETSSEDTDDSSVEIRVITPEDVAHARNLLKCTYGMEDKKELEDVFVSVELPCNMLPGDFPSAEAFWDRMEEIAGVLNAAELKEELDRLDPQQVPTQLWTMRTVEGTLPRWAAPLVTDQILSEFYRELDRRAAVLTR